MLKLTDEADGLIYINHQMIIYFYRTHGAVENIIATDTDNERLEKRRSGRNKGNFTLIQTCEPGTALLVKETPEQILVQIRIIQAERPNG